MTQNSLTDRTILFVKEKLHSAEAGHDWFHIERVWKLAKHIGTEEGDVNMEVVELGALLHDIADAKFHDGDEEIGPKTAHTFLESQNVDTLTIEQVENIIRHISFKSNIEGQTWTSPELCVVQDADRLDAIGAIGIARAFTYGGFKNRPLFNPDITPNLSMSKDEYKTSVGTTINHFYEKLLLLKDKMNTHTGAKMALARHNYMLRFLEEFKNEWKGVL